MTRPGSRSALFGALMLAGACSPEGSLAPSPCVLPSILGSDVSANANNVLSAVITARVRDADSVSVRYTRGGELLSQWRPAEMPSEDEVLLPLFGLQPESGYEAAVVAFNECGSAASDRFTFSTGSLPVDLPVYAASGSSPSPGFVAFAAGNYGLVIDNIGRVVWYHRFAGGAGLNFQPQPNGRYVARPNPAPGQIGRWVEIDPLGVTTRTLGCAGNLQPRLHDLIAEADGGYWILCDELKSVELVPGDPSSRRSVLGTAVQNVSASDELLFHWSPFDHLQIDLSVLDPSDVAGAVVNWTHGNSLDLDGQGNLYVSFRNLSQIAKIDTRTGNVLWLFGGSGNQFEVEGSSTVPFARQHGVRVIDGGLLLLDNLGETGPSRAELYTLNEGARSARLSATYSSSTDAVAFLGGSTQRLTNGNVLVSFGNGGSVEEYDAAGNVVWKLEGEPGYVFRAQRVQSLYRPGVNETK